MTSYAAVHSVPMRWLLDCLYLCIAAVTSPIWLIRMLRTGKFRTDWRGRFGHVPAEARPRDDASNPRVLIHAVSVGEVNAIRRLVDTLEQPGAGERQATIVIATTTDTGFARAKALWGGRHAIVRYPLDCSWMVERFLDAVHPHALVLVELEVWPNFVAACSRRQVPVCIVNGRLSARSFRRYRWVAWALRRTFGQLAFAAVQDAVYAERFLAMGVQPGRVHVTGTMKWDSAEVGGVVPEAEALGRHMGIDRTRPLIVAGSTAPNEHAMLHAATPKGVQLLCGPRKPEWFDQAANDLPGCVRRSNPALGDASSDRFLLDTIGELRMAYALADIVIVGRSFGNLHGSDMMEPASLGKPVIVGPAVSDFAATVEALLAGDGIIRTSAEDLPQQISSLLDNPERRRLLGENARAVIRAHQGATARHAAMILDLLHRAKKPSAPTERRGGGGGERRKAESEAGRPTC